MCTKLQMSSPKYVGVRVPCVRAAPHLPGLHRLPRLQEADLHSEEQPRVPGLHPGQGVLPLLDIRD